MNSNNIMIAGDPAGQACYLPYNGIFAECGLFLYGPPFRIFGIGKMESGK